MRRIVILTSSEPTEHLPAILDSQTEAFNGQIVCVVSSHGASPALKTAVEADVAIESLDFSEYCRWGKPGALYEEDLAHLLQKYSPDLILLEGWSVPLSRRFVRYFPWRVLGISKGLTDDAGEPITLPDGSRSDTLTGLTGQNAVQAALASTASHIGSTVHVVLDSPEYGPVVTHAKVELQPGETPESLEARWQAAEQASLIKSLSDLCRDATVRN
jgi:phosphoribosylglycinamide formyltransferase-1